MYGCPRTYKTFQTLRTHVYDVHGSDPHVTNQCPQQPTTYGGVMNNPETLGDDMDSRSGPGQPQQSAATHEDFQPMDFGLTDNSSDGTESQGIYANDL